MNVSRIGVDLAENDFQIFATDRSGRALWRHQLRRSHWMTPVVKRLQPDSEIDIEACSGAHRWAREFKSRGFEPN